MDSAIQARGLVRRFGHETAVAGVDLDIANGEIYGFLGPNGAGKSTTVRMLCTLLSPTEGTATVAGHDVGSEPDAVRLRIGVALQEAGLDDKQTGREILELQGRMYGMRGDVLNRRISEIVQFIDIGDAIDRLIGTYSGGMKRRVDLAAGLLHEPDVLFLDEPTTGLDPVSRAVVWDEVRRLNSDLGITIFLTTQYLEEADVLCDRVGIINDGELVAEGMPEELKRSVGTDLIIARVDAPLEQTIARIIGLAGVSDVSVHDRELTVAATDGAAVVNDLVLTLNNSGVRAETLILRSPTLDDVFLNVTGNRIQTSEGADA